jgi:hypothetical protein
MKMIIVLVIAGAITGIGPMLLDLIKSLVVNR